MDKLRNVAKGGWHPGGDRPIHRDSWKTDLKGIATGKKNDPYEAAREHQSRPLASLRDPDSFGPPPRHTGAHGSSSGSRTNSIPSQSGPQGGLGSAVPPPAPRNVQVEEEENEPPAPSLPYRSNTTGLRTDNLPKPPVRRADAGSPVSTTPNLPPRQPPRSSNTQVRGTPTLPPRQNEFPDEYTPPPPPPYSEAPQSSQREDPAYLNAGAVSNLSQAGISVPGFGIGSNPGRDSAQSQIRGPQLSELQQRFARMNTDNQTQMPPSPAIANPPAQKKAPPPPPPKKLNLAGANPTANASVGNSSPPPPPLPLSSKPRPI